MPYTVYEGTAYVSSPFGPRIHPITGKQSMHNGKDQVGQQGKNQRCVVPEGKVLQVNTGYQSGRGNNVVIQSINDPYRPGHDVRLRYQHQSSTTLKVGQAVKLGDIVGVEGSTGDSTGSHCHFEVTVDGIPVDPSPWDGLPNAVGTYTGKSDPFGPEPKPELPSGSVTMLPTFTPEVPDLEVFSAPDVYATIPDGAGGTKRLPVATYVVFEEKPLTGIEGVVGVKIQVPGAYVWAAKLPGKYKDGELALEDALRGGFPGDGTAQDYERSVLVSYIRQMQAGAKQTLEAGKLALKKMGVP